MREIYIKENESGQRFDKFLKKYLSEAPGSFLYKMLRKKNIVLNGRKATGDVYKRQTALMVGKEDTKAVTLWLRTVKRERVRL